MNVRWMKLRNGKLVLQQYTQIGTDKNGHVIFGWVEVEVVNDPNAPHSPQDTSDG
jgi:hypothetical protein